MRHFSPIAKKDFQTIRPFHESWQIKELKRHEFLLINLAPFSTAFISDTYDGGKYRIIKKKKKNNRCSDFEVYEVLRFYMLHVGSL